MKSDKNPNEVPKISEMEWEVMKTLWKHGPFHHLHVNGKHRVRGMEKPVSTGIRPYGLMYARLFALLSAFSGRFPRHPCSHSSSVLYFGNGNAGLVPLGTTEYGKRAAQVGRDARRNGS